MLLENVFGSQDLLVQLARFFLTLGVGMIFTRAVLMPLTEKFFRRRRDEKTLHSIVNITGIIGLFFSLTVALQAGSFGNLATIIGAIAAALTVAVGFGMRDQVGNIVAGIFLHFDNPFIRGDYIQVGEVEGQVREIKLRETVLNGISQEKTLVPNSQITNNPTKNYTKGSKTKTVVATRTEPGKIEENRELLEQAAEEHEKVLEKPEPETALNSTDEIEVELHYWIKNPGELKKVRTQVLQEYLEKAREKGILKEEKE